MKKKRRLRQSDTFWGCAAALLVLLQFWWLPGEDGSAADSYSTTIDGKLGLYRTLSELFPNVERDALNVVPPVPATLVMVASDRYPTLKEEQQLYEFVYNGGNLLFAPNWMTPRVAYDENGNEIHFDDRKVSISSLGIELTYRQPEASALDVAVSSVPVSPAVPAGTATAPKQSTTEDGQMDTAAADSSTTASGDVPSPSPSSQTDPAAGPASVAPGGAVPIPPGAPGTAVKTEDSEKTREIGTEVVGHSPLVSDPVIYRTTATLNLPQHLTCETLIEDAAGNVEAATWTMGFGRVVVCSSADIFSNRTMLFKPGRRLAVRLVERAASRDEEDPAEPRIVISEYFNASDAYQSTGILLSPTLRIGTLQLVLVAVLGIWMAFHRFGPAMDVTTLQRRTLTESAQAVGNLQYRLQDGGAVVRGYLDYMRSQLRRRYGSFLRLDQPESIANRAGMDAAEVRSRLKDAELMAKSDRLSSAQTADMLRWLARLQQRLTGNRNAP